MRGCYVQTGAIRVVQKAPGSIGLIDGRGQMQTILQHGVDWPARGRVRHRVEHASERLFVAEKIDGVLSPVAEVRLHAAGGGAVAGNVDLEVFVSGDGILHLEGANARTGAPLQTDIVPAVGGFFEALSAAR